MTDSMRERFEAWCWPNAKFDNVELARVRGVDNKYIIPFNSMYSSFAAGYQAAQADARALVGEMYDYIMNDECTQYLPEKLLTKAQAFMEGK